MAEEKTQTKKEAEEDLAGEFHSLLDSGTVLENGEAKKLLNQVLKNN